MPRASRASRRAPDGGAGQPGQLLVAEARALHGREELGGLVVGGIGEPLAGHGHFALERHVPAHLGEEPRRDAGRLADHGLGDAASEQPEQPPQPRVRRFEELAQHDRCGAALGEPSALAGLP